MKVTLNERSLDLPDGATVADVVRDHRPTADVLVRNGFPTDLATVLVDGDRLALFERGGRPSDDELWALLCARHTPGVAERLRRGTVGVAGLGGLGSHVAVALARAGVGTLVLVDFDVVEPTNINRQHFYLDQLGQPKVEALRATIGRVTPFTRVVGHVRVVDESNALDLFSDCQVVVEAFDGAGQKVMLIETLQTGRPDLFVVAGSGMAGYGPANAITTTRHGTLYVCGDGTSAAGPGEGLMAPRVGVAAHHQANQALRLLLGLTD